MAQTMDSLVNWLLKEMDGRGYDLPVLAHQMFDIYLGDEEFWSNRGWRAVYDHLTKHDYSS